MREKKNFLLANWIYYGNRSGLISQKFKQKIKSVTYCENLFVCDKFSSESIFILLQIHNKTKEKEVEETSFWNGKNLSQTLFLSIFLLFVFLLSFFLSSHCFLCMYTNNIWANEKKATRLNKKKLFFAFVQIP